MPSPAVDPQNQTSITKAREAITLETRSFRSTPPVTHHRRRHSHNPVFETLEDAASPYSLLALRMDHGSPAFGHGNSRPPTSSRGSTNPGLLRVLQRPPRRTTSAPLPPPGRPAAQGPHRWHDCSCSTGLASQSGLSNLQRRRRIRRFRNQALHPGAILTGHISTRTFPATF